MKSLSHVQFFCNPMDYSLSGSFVQGIFQARTLEWAAIPFSRRSSQPRDWTQVSCIVGIQFMVWTTREVNRILEWATVSFSRESSWPRIEPVSPVSPALAGSSLPLSHQHSTSQYHIKYLREEKLSHARSLWNRRIRNATSWLDLEWTQIWASLIFNKLLEKFTEFFQGGSF